MKHRKLCSGLALTLAMLVLILDGKTAVSGARTGLELCLQTVIPCLLPFFLLTNLAAGLLMGERFPVLEPLARLCRLPAGGSAFLIPAFLGGYPMGAQAVASAWKQGDLRKEDACRMLAFCSNAGPAFLFGMVSPLFSESWRIWSLWAIHIAGAVFTAAILPGSPGTVGRQEHRACGYGDAMTAALRGLSSVCGWVICFRILLAFCGRRLSASLPVTVQVVAAGLLELTNGCSLLPLIQSEDLRYVITAGLLGCGGVCVAMQTASLLQGLPIRPYLVGKGIQTAVSLLLAVSAVRGFWVAVVPALLIFMAVFPKMQRNSGIPRLNAV